MRDKEMYLYLMLADFIFTAVLELWTQADIGKEEVTKEMWLEMSAINVERRKSAMEIMRSHGQNT